MMHVVIANISRKKLHNSPRLEIAGSLDGGFRVSPFFIATNLDSREDVLHVEQVRPER